jgi:ribonuclease HI
MATSVVYVDGSYMPDTGIGGVGVYWGYPGHPRNVSINVGQIRGSVVAEVTAFLHGLHGIAADAWGRGRASTHTYHIVTDCAVITAALKKQRAPASVPTKLWTAVRRAWAAVQAFTQYSLVRSHCGCDGNAYADTLAKQACHK